MPSNWDFLLRILVAMALSGAVGLERELNDKTAGFRTHITVALGCCLFGLISAYGFESFGDLPRNDSSYQVDVTRIASTMVTGIGFLGGGAIIKHGASIRGLTTAASVWVTAAIGLSCSFGLYYLATLTTGALLFALVILKMPVGWIEDRFGRDSEDVVISMQPGADPGGVITALHELTGVEVRSLRVRDLEDRCVVQADLRATRRGAGIEALLGPILDHEGVAEVDVT